MKGDLKTFMKVLQNNKSNLTTQQFRTIKGQAMVGDIQGGLKGLNKLLERSCG